MQSQRTTATKLYVNARAYVYLGALIVNVPLSIMTIRFFNASAHLQRAVGLSLLLTVSVSASCGIASFRSYQSAGVTPNP